MGIIYLITTTASRKVYIGQTIHTMTKRWKDHKNCARMLREYNEGIANFDTESANFRTIRSSVLYRAMVKHGVDTFSIALVESMEDSLLNDAETMYIEYYDCQVPNGYNLTSGGDSGYNHSERSIELMKQMKFENLEDNRHEYLRTLPPCTSYGKNPKRGGEWILVQNHPLCTYRCFLFKDYGNDLERVQLEVINFVYDLEAGGVPYEYPKKEQDLKPYPGLKATKKGYKLEKYINGKKYQAGFESQTFTREENKARAIEYYELNITPIIKNAVQRLNVGGV